MKLYVLKENDTEIYATSRLEDMKNFLGRRYFYDRLLETHVNVFILNHTIDSINQEWPIDIRVDVAHLK